MLSSRTSFSIIFWKTKSSCGYLDSCLCCAAHLQLKNISLCAACFTVSSLSKAGWLVCVEKVTCYRVTAHGKTKGKKKEEPVFVRAEVCFFSQSLTAATSTLTIASRGTVIPEQLQWASGPAPRLGERWSLRRGILPSSEELYFFRLSIQGEEASPWAFPVGFLAV